MPAAQELSAEPVDHPKTERSQSVAAKMPPPAGTTSGPEWPALNSTIGSDSEHDAGTGLRWFGPVQSISLPKMPVNFAAWIASWIDCDVIGVSVGISCRTRIKLPIPA